MYMTSQGGNSSDDETALTGEWVVGVLQSRFNRGEEDTGPDNGISIEMRSKRRRSVETANVSSKSHIVSNGATSWRRLVRGREASGGAVRVEDILIDVNEDLVEPGVLSEFGVRRHSLRLRFPPHQVGADTCIWTIDRGVQDTHLQHRRGGERYVVFPSWSFRFRLYAYTNE